VGRWWRRLSGPEQATLIAAVLGAVVTVVLTGALAIILARFQGGTPAVALGPTTSSSASTTTATMAPTTTAIPTTRTTTTTPTTTTTTPPPTPPPFPETAEEAARLFKVSNAEAQLQKTPFPTKGWHTDQPVPLSVFATACVDVQHGPVSVGHIVQGQPSLVGTSSDKSFDRYAMRTNGVVTGAATIYWGGCPSPP
jgi:hypothetical protein